MLIQVPSCENEKRDGVFPVAKSEMGCDVFQVAKSEMGNDVLQIASARLSVSVMRCDVSSVLRESAVRDGVFQVVKSEMGCDMFQVAKSEMGCDMIQVAKSEMRNDLLQICCTRASPQRRRKTAGHTVRSGRLCRPSYLSFTMPEEAVGGLASGWPGSLPLLLSLLS